MINTIEKSLARLKTKKKKTNHQYQEWNRGYSTDYEDIKRIKREHCEWLYKYKLGNVEKMDQFLGKHKLSQLTQYEII